jgi:hypothetical protein
MPDIFLAQADNYLLKLSERFFFEVLARNGNSLAGRETPREWTPLRGNLNVGLNISEVWT